MSNMNKVFLAGLLTAILSAMIPALQGTFSWYTILFSVSIAGLSYATKNLKGQIWSILGILVGALINFFTAHPEPTGITFKYVMVSYFLPLAIQILGALQGSSAKTE
jgi:hypothetical protein